MANRSHQNAQYETQSNEVNLWDVPVDRFPVLRHEVNLPVEVVAERNRVTADPSVHSAFDEANRAGDPYMMGHNLPYHAAERSPIIEDPARRAYWQPDAAHTQPKSGSRVLDHLHAVRDSEMRQRVVGGLVPNPYELTDVYSGVRFMEGRLHRVRDEMNAAIEAEQTTNPLAPSVPLGTTAMGNMLSLVAQMEVLAGHMADEFPRQLEVLNRASEAAGSGVTARHADMYLVSLQHKLTRAEARVQELTTQLASTSERLERSENTRQQLAHAVQQHELRASTGAPSNTQLEQQHQRLQNSYADLQRRFTAMDADFRNPARVRALFFGQLQDALDPTAFKVAEEYYSSLIATRSAGTPQPPRTRGRFESKRGRDR